MTVERGAATISFLDSFLTDYYSLTFAWDTWSDPPDARSIHLKAGQKTQDGGMGAR